VVIFFRAFPPKPCTLFLLSHACHMLCPPHSPQLDLPNDICGKKVSKVKQSRYTPRRRFGERRYSSYSFTTSALDGGEWSASRPGRVLPQGKGPRYPLYRRLGGPQSRSGHRG
jgi:hypothetical protein